MTVLRAKAVSGGDLVKLTETILGSDTPNITFTGIPTGYKDLIVRFKYRTSNATFDNLEMRVGTGSIDTGANYSYYTTYAISQNGAYSANDSMGRLAVNPGANRNAGIFGQGEITIYDYLSSQQKMMIGRAFYYERAVEAFYDQINVLWTGTTAIDQVRLYPSVGTNLKAGSFAALYGRV